MSKELPVINSCSGCGACCLEQESPPGYVGYLTGAFPFDAEDEDSVRVANLPPELKRELREYIAEYTRTNKHPRGGICIWWDSQTHGCKHYEQRPQICRDFEMGTPECRDWREQYGVK